MSYRNEEAKAVYQLAREVAAELGEGWRWLEEGNVAQEGYAIGEVIHPDGRQFSLSIGRGRVEVSGDWPRYTDEDGRQQWVTPRDVWPNPECERITIALQRGAKALAREIERRFLPNYTEARRQVDAKIRQTQAWTAAKVALREHFEAKYGIEFGRDHSRWVTYVLGTQRLRINSGDSVNLELTSCEPGLIEAVFDAVHAYHRAKAEAALIHDAARAVEVCEEDELERYAADLRRKQEAS